MKAVGIDFGKTRRQKMQNRASRYTVGSRRTQGSSVQAAWQRVNSQVELPDVPVTKMADVVEEIVGIEGPIHQDEVARRVAAAFGKARTGSKIQAASDRALLDCAKSNRLVRDGQFWMTAEQRENIPIRNRDNEVAPITRAEFLSPLEIRAAAELITKESGAMDPDELVRAISRLLGYKRAGQVSGMC